MFLSLSRKWHLSCWAALFAAFLILSSCTQASPQKNAVLPRVKPTPTPTLMGAARASFRPFMSMSMSNITSPFLVFDYQISDPAAIAKYYDFVWGASVKNVAAFRSGNPNIFLTYYIPFHTDWGTFTDNTPRNLAYWQSVHPDWILYKCDRTTPAYHNGDVPLDFSNPAFVSWEIETYAKPASQAGYDGVAVDNLIMSNRYNACGSFINGKWVQLYSGKVDDPHWRANIVNWLAQMQQALHGLQHPLALIPNLSFEGFAPTDPQMQQLVSHIDGLLDEGGFTSYGREAYLASNDWVQRVQFMMKLQEQQKPYFLVELFHSIGSVEIQWALASYLMGKGQLGGMLICTQNEYGSDVRYSEYNTPIGSPLGPMYQAQNVYFRKFTHGLSIVNPSGTMTYITTLTPGYVYTDIYGNAVSQTVTLPPLTGLVLLSTS